MNPILPARATDERLLSITGMRRIGVALEHALPYAFMLFYLATFISLLNRDGGIERFVLSTDFMAVMTGAQLINEGGGASLYDLDMQHEVQKRILSPYTELGADEIVPFNHLPFEALVIVPLMSLSYVGVTLYWMLLLASILWAALYILHRSLPLTRSWLMVVVICALSYFPVFRAFMFGQNSTIVLLGICATYASIRQDGAKWDKWAGIGMVLVAFKPQVLPLVLLLVLMEGRWKAIVWFGVEFGTLAVVCMPILGIMWPLQFANLLLDVAKWSSSSVINPAIMHNWRGFATNIVGSISSSGSNLLILFMTAVSMLLFLYAWWNTRRHNYVSISSLSVAHDGSNRVIALNVLWALGTVTAILVSPHLNPHDLTLLIFPGWIMVYTIQNSDLPKRLSVYWAYLLKVIYLIVPVVFLTSGDSPLGVILNVSALALSTWLFVVTIKSTHMWGGTSQLGFQLPHQPKQLEH